MWAEIIATAIAAPALAFAVLAEAAAAAFLTLAAPNFVVGAECRAIALSALLLAEVVDAEGGPAALAAQLLFLAMLADARKGFAFLALRLGCAMLADRRVRASPRIVHEGRSQHAIQLRRLNEYHHARRPENQQCAMPGDLNQLCAMPGRRPACRRHWWWRWHWRWNWRRHCRWSCISWTPVHPLWRAGRHRDCNLVARHGTLARHDWVQEQPGTLLPGRGHSALSWCKGRLRAKAQRRRGHSTRHAPRCRSLAQRRALTRGFKARRKFFGPGQSPRNGRDFQTPAKGWLVGQRWKLWRSS